MDARTANSFRRDRNENRQKGHSNQTIFNNVSTGGCALAVPASVPGLMLSRSAGKEQRIRFAIMSDWENMKRVAIHCRYTSHHFAIKKLIHGLVGSLERRRDNITYIWIVNRNNVSEFAGYKKGRAFVLPFHSDNVIANHLFNLLILPFVLKWVKADTIVFPQISFFLYTGVRTVLFIHDLIEYQLRNQSWSKHLTRHLFFPIVARISDVIATLSESSKSDIVRLLKVPECKVAVAYVGVDHIRKYADIQHDAAAEHISSAYGVSGYVLYVGYLSHPQKNLLRLIEAFKMLIAQDGMQDKTLLFVGPKGKDYGLIFDKVKESGISSHFKYLGTVDEHDLACLYIAADVFCFPSLYEGFGMPVAEAMTCGCPVITSKTSSLPEVVGDAGLLVDPSSTEEITASLRYLYQNNDVAYSMACLGKTRSTRFSWDRFSAVVADLM
jgi:glycosyltransferase involved in cell wall biosynthesis